MSHVQSIKKRFEKLNLTNEIAALGDIEPLNIRENSANNTFQRSVTLFDFSPPNSKNCQDLKNVVFQRQNSDNSNSSYKSLRRSQAFRLDVERKPNLIKSSPVTPKLKRQNAVRQTNTISNKDATCSKLDEINYLSTSDTIKKALKQPLPPGPAPKKPPRTFASSPKTSPINENRNIIDDIKRVMETNKQNEFNQNKMFDLEKRSTTLPKTSSNIKVDKKNVVSFLSCIISPCSIDPIYYEQIKQERKQHDLNLEDRLYMEPYEHLNHMNNNSLSISNRKPEELHYLCTNILDQTNNNSTNSHNDINGSFLDSNTESSDIESYEKINILMDVVYDEKRRDNIIDESSGSSELETKCSVPKVSRSLTEKRKNYVRRVTETLSSKDLNSCQQSATSMISHFQRVIDSNNHGTDFFSPKKLEKGSLFKMVLLVGYDMMNHTGYVKSLFPKNEKPPPMIEQFIYPSKKYASDLMTKENQTFTVILTDEFGNNLFGYCRQIVAEGFEEKCLPLTYCIITKTNASGFYFSLLKEIESRHGFPEVQFSSMIKSLQIQELPKNGKSLNVKLLESSKMRLPEIGKQSVRETNQKVSPNRAISKRLSLEPPEWLRAEASILLQNKSNETISVNQRKGDKNTDEILIKRTNDVRLQNEELAVLYENTTKELLVMIFGTLLIERKVILLGKNVSQVTSCVSALYSLLYPFQWHHIIIALIPEQTIELLQAPFPYFAGVLKNSINIESLEIEDGIVVDLDTKTLLRKCGDEATLIPETLKKSLLLSLKIVEALEKEEKLRNVLIAEAFLQYFIKLFAKLDTKKYNKLSFIESHDDQAIRYFLEWFLDTIMFKEFLSKKQNDDKKRENEQPSESYFELFDIKVLEKSATLSDNQQRKNVEMLMKSSKQKKKNFKDKIKDFLKS